MKIIDLFENIILFFFVWFGISIFSIIFIIFISLIYLFYLFNFRKISKVNNNLFDLLYELVDMYKLDRKWIEIENKRVFVVERKSILENTIPLIFIHGTFSCSVTFYELFSKIPKEYHCIAIDLPNFGITDRFNINLNKISRKKFLHLYVNFLNKVIEKLGFNKINLFGHSLGAIICLNYALKNKEKVNELFLLSIPGLYCSAGNYGYYSGVFFKYLLPPKLCRFGLIKYLEKPLLYFFRNKNIFLRFWILFCFRTEEGNDIIGRFISTSFFDGYWKNPLLLKIIKLRVKTNIWIGKDDFFLDKYGKINFPNIKLKKISGTHNVFNNYEEFIPSLCEELTPYKENKIYKKNKLKETKYVRLYRFLRDRYKWKSFPSLRRTDIFLKNSRERLNKILKN